MEQFFQDQFLTDVSLCTVDNCSLDCHKVILVAACQQFWSALDDEESINMVNVSVDYDVLHRAVKFIYSGSCDINLDTVEPLIHISKEWHLLELEHRCATYIQHQLTIETCVYYHQLSSSLPSELLHTHTRYFIQRHFGTLVALRAITKLSLDDLDELLVLDYLNCDGDDDKLHAIHQWVESEGPSDVLPLLLSRLNPAGVSAECLKSLANDPVLNQTSFIMDALVLKIDHPRSQIDHLVMKNNRKLCSYNVQDQTWHDVMDIPAWEDVCTAWTAHGGCVCIVGARESNEGNHGAVLDVEHQRCINLPNLPLAIEGPGLLITEGFLYVMGGTQIDPGTYRQSSAMHRIQMKNPSHWEMMPSMPMAVSWPLVSDSPDHLVVIGGYNSDYKATGNIQMYSKQTEQWSMGLELPKPCTALGTGMVVVKGIIHLVNCTESMNIDLEAKKVKVIEFRRKQKFDERVSVVMYNSEMLVCGKSRGVMVVYRFDPADLDNHWHAKDVGAGKVSSQYKFAKVRF